MAIHKIPTFQEVKDWVNTSAYVPNADHADSADDSANLNGVSASGYTRLRDGVDFPVYATTGDVPTSITEGEVVYISGEGQLYVEDGN